MDTLASYLDFANHRANSTPAEIKTLCSQVIQYGFHAAFINPCYLKLAKETLGGKAPVGTVVSFPLGQDAPEVKATAANLAVAAGADELDVVPNLGLYLAGDREGFLAEMQTVVAAGRGFGQPVVIKFIIETGFFDKEADKSAKLAEAAKLVREAGADFVKLGSGWGPRGVMLDDLQIVKTAVADSLKIKVSGGIDSRTKAEAFIAAGASRIGTSQAVKIITEQK